ncbi:MAG TPA: SOS response-associated peptidase [Longimicrobiales bacterium]
MCGRYTLTSTPEELTAEFGLAAVPGEYRPRYNIAPGQPVAVLLAGEDGPQFRFLRWGLVPFWADDPAIGHRVINARAEGLATRPAFRRPFERRRCLVLADGFYEWRRDPGGKTPMLVRLASRRPFALAGLWDRWVPRDGGEPLDSCTIVTTEASPFLRPIHDRMPVILDRGEREEWLRSDTSPERLRELLRPYGGELEAYEVSRLVNSPANDVPACVEPV